MGRKSKKNIKISEHGFFGGYQGKLISKFIFPHPLKDGDIVRIERKTTDFVDGQKKGGNAPGRQGARRAKRGATHHKRR